ncbi:MAG: LysR family transcriptional regulator [Eubacteriales bacterium]
MIDNISRYQTFVAVAECNSISEAAKKLFVSQPAVSTEIASLEKALSAKLFFRSNRGVALTPEGKILYDNIKMAFSFIEAGEEKLRQVGELQGGVLRIGASDMTLRFFLLNHITAFQQNYPAVRLSVLGNPTPRTLEVLRSGQVDMAVVSEPFTAADMADFVLIPVRKVQDIFVAKSTFVPATEKKITKSKLASFPLILLEKRTNTRRYIDAWLGGDGTHPVIELTTSDLLLEFAERGIGVASIVEDFALESLESGRVVKLDLEQSPPPRAIYVAYLKRQPPSAAALKMIEPLSRIKIN